MMLSCSTIDRPPCTIPFFVLFCTILYHLFVPFCTNSMLLIFFVHIVYVTNKICTGVSYVTECLLIALHVVHLGTVVYG